MTIENLVSSAKVTTGRRVRITGGMKEFLGAAIVASGLAASALPAGAQNRQPTPAEFARNGQLYDICHPLPINITACMNDGVDYSNRLWKMHSARPFKDAPDFKGPPLPPMPTCRYALAACVMTDQPCPWREQVEELIKKSSPCEFPE
jgi:hypothetical protein